VIWLAPTGKSGVADYARVLHTAVPPVAGVTVFHLGNNQLHEPIYRRLLGGEDPKRVVILHDAVLHHFMLGSLSREAYVEEFVYNYGEWHRALAQELWSRRSTSGSAPEYFAYPMLRRAMEAADLVIVHNPGAGRMAREHGAERVEMLPHFIESGQSPRLAEVLDWRASVGVEEGTCLFGVFGHLRESKRIPAIVRAMAPQTGVALLVQGEWGSPVVEPAGVIRVGAVDEGRFRLLIEAVDVGINLRYPSAGESSGVLARLMAARKPVMVTQGEEVSHLPAGVVWPVLAGPGEHEALTYGIAYLAQHAVARREMGLAAYRYAQAECGVEVLGPRLAGLLASV
jgi:hypothetical protein